MESNQQLKTGGFRVSEFFFKQLLGVPGLSDFIQKMIWKKIIQGVLLR